MSATLPSSTLCCDEEFCDSPITVSVPGAQGPVGPPGPAASGDIVGFFIKNTLPEARAIPPSATNRFLILLGTDVAGNTFGGDFWYDVTSNDLDDYTNFGGSTINSDFNSGSGRWKRM